MSISNCFGKSAKLDSLEMQDVKASTRWDILGLDFFNEFCAAEATPLAARQVTAEEPVKKIAEAIQRTQAPAFADVDSSKLLQIQSVHPVQFREHFQDLPLPPPPRIGKSSFVPLALVEHLMRNKKPSALGKKYEEGDAITNMEGLLHTFVTPLCSAQVVGDFQWEGKIKGFLFGENFVRPIIMSAAIHPDFEFKNVVWPLVALGRHETIGQVFESWKIPSKEEKMDLQIRHSYEKKIRQHLVYHLTADHRLPALQELSPEQIMEKKEAISYLNTLCFSSIPAQLNHRFVRVKSGVVSLEILLNLYKEQIRNEFKILNSHTPQGYIYTIHPPAIFASEVEGAALLNRLQALAFKELKEEGLFSNMKGLGFANYADPSMLKIYQKILPDTPIFPFASLYPHGHYQGLEGCALVLHNNSDAFGQNIETEGPTSLDGLLGCTSNASYALRRERTDLLDFVM